MTKHEYAESLSFVPVFEIYLELEKEMNKLQKNLTMCTKEQRIRYAHAFYQQRVKCKEIACRYIWEYANTGMPYSLWKEKCQVLHNIINSNIETWSSAINHGDLPKLEALCEQTRKDFYMIMAEKYSHAVQKFEAVDIIYSDTEYVPFWEEIGLNDKQKQIDIALICYDEETFQTYTRHN